MRGILRTVSLLIDFENVKGGSHSLSLHLILNLLLSGGPRPAWGPKQLPGLPAPSRRACLMDRLGDRLLYSDTDSVIFVSRDGDWEPPLGPYLGDLTDEIGGDDYITEFCSGGPKTYGYRTAVSKTCMKAKGITLISENSKVVRLDTLIDLVDHYLLNQNSSRHILSRADGIVRNKKNLTLKNKSVVKRFKVVYNKRVLLSDFSTLSYGY